MSEPDFVERGEIWLEPSCIKCYGHEAATIAPRTAMTIIGARRA